MRQRSLQRIAIVDDMPDQAQMLRFILEDAELTPVVITGKKFDSAAELVRTIERSADAAICDHRLRMGGLVPADGAEIVGSLVKEKFPAILLTQYMMDADVSIRKWRPWVPVVLERDHVDAGVILQSFEKCRAEIAGSLSRERQPWRSLVRVVALQDESGEKVVDVIVPNWNPNKAVRLPVAELPSKLADSLAPGSRFFAMVNTGTENSDDLFFRDFEEAPAVP